MSDQVPNEVTITRIFDAPRAMVYQAFTDPKIVAEWWGPKFFTNPVCELDVRPGGTLLIHMQGPDGVIYPDKGVYHEIVEPERLVFTSGAFEDENGRPELEVLTTITFAEVGEKTQLTLHAKVLRATPAVMGALAGMEEGWSQSFDKLAYQLAHAGEQEEATEAGVKNANGKSIMDIDADKREITVSRVFDAPRELVFQVYTDPKLVPQWWGPRGLTTVVDRMELRVGGSWRFVQHDPGGNEYAFNGYYWEIKPPERLVYSFEWEEMPGHDLLEIVTFEEQDGKTKVTTVDRFQNTGDLYGMVQSGMEEGVAASLDRFTELLQEIQKEPRRVNL